MTFLAPHTIDVAMTIKRQIGLDSWLAVSGRDQKAGVNADGDVVLAFRFGPRHGLARWVEITYRGGRDTYDVTAYKVHRNGVRRVLSCPDSVTGIERAEWTDVYAEQLPTLIRRANVIGDLS